MMGKAQKMRLQFNRLLKMLHLVRPSVGLGQGVGYGCFSAGRAMGPLVRINGLARYGFAKLLILMSEMVARRGAKFFVALMAANVTVCATA
ncbi:MAG: hypothetical protein JXJ18_08915 [Rhodobacteraceae bacterium]|nr:hypothetical protein [Paracoccaceae bacterium]